MSEELPTEEIEQALKIAGEMIDAGIAVFAAPPCPAAHGGVCGRTGHDTGKEEYDLPGKWQLTVPSRVWLERWRPGWALGAVGGRVADFLDEDPRHGGDASVKELEDAGQWPRVFGVQATPSGGFHHLISPVGEREANGFLPGLDYQGGRPDGTGRAFVFIAPTVKRSKDAATAGELHPYRWLQPPDLDYLREFDGGDDTVEGVRTRLAAARERKGVSSAPDDRTVREFTEDEAKTFCNITLDRLMKAEIGEIEQFANDAACQLSHFVPQFWSEELAYGVLTAALAETAYDPNGPSTWTAEKFRAVLAGEGERAPTDWRAERVVQSVDEAVAAVTMDAVDALIAEMISPEEVAGRPAPKALIKGLLNLDSESWIIGEPGSKKSFVAQDMAGHVARGMPWQGLKVTQADVVMIVAEGAGGMSSRVKAWEKAYGPMGANVRILPRPVQAKDLQKWAVLVEACRRLKPGLIVLDTQARITVGLEENSATEMGIYIEAVRALREATGGCVLTVHHTGRKGGDARGTSAIDGAQHTELKVEVDKSNKLRGRLLVEKQKDMEMRSPLLLGFEVKVVGVDEDGDDLTSLVLMPSDVWADSQIEERPEEPGREIVVREPEDWTFLLFEHNRQDAKRRILQVIKDLAGETGRTEAQIRKTVAERWYGGQVGRVGGTLNEQTWNGHWTGVMAASWSEGKVIVPGSVGGWMISPDYLLEINKAG